VSWYERVRRRDFGVLENLSALGTTLIALRIANGYSQKELADRMGVSEAQVSRDERNEYHGITVERAQKVLDALGETLESRVEDKPLAPA
jgi:transcriptional regulator with XRE-family HTH domain